MSFLAALSTAASADLIGQWTFENGSLEDGTGNWPDLELKGNAQIVDGELDVNGSGTNATGWAATGPGDYAGGDIGEKTLVAWITIQSPSPSVRAGSAITIDTQTGDQFDGIIFAERDPNRWMNGSNGFSRTPSSFANGNETATDGTEQVQVAITYEDTGGGGVRITGYRNGMEMGQYDDNPFAVWSPGNVEIILGKRHGDPNSGAPGGLDALIDEARIYDEVLSVTDIAALTLGTVTDTDGDGLADEWEQELIDADPNDALEILADVNPDDDLDGDGLTNLQEFTFPRTNPLKADTDDDGLNDNVETRTGVFVDATDTGTDPNKADSDGDRLSDGDEVADPFSDPNDPNDPPTPLENTLIGRWSFEPGEELVDLTGNWPDLSLEGDAQIVDGQLDVNGTGTTATGWAYTTGGDYEGPEIRDKTLVSWVTLENLEEVVKAGSALTIDKVGSDQFDGIIFAERELNRWMNGSDNYQRTMNWTPGFAETAPGEQIMMAITYEDLGGNRVRVTGYRNGEEIGSYEDDPIGVWTTGDAEVIFGKRHGNPATSGPGGLDALIDSASIYGQAATASQVADIYAAGPDGGAAKLRFSVTGSGDDLVFEWDSLGGKLYNLRSETDPSAAEPIDWPIYNLIGDIEATPPENTLVIRRPVDPTRFFVIEEFNAPPVAIFTDDFEGGLGDWTIGSDGDAGTAWELGSPTNVGPAVAHSPSNCFGTNLSSNYLVDANVWLRSPVLDLTGVGGATLNYYQFLDIEEGFDFGEVAVLDAADNSQLAVIASPIDGLTTDWEQVSKSIPAAALGRNVKIEFRFTSDDIENFAGWYVDDVTVTVP